MNLKEANRLRSGAEFSADRTHRLALWRAWWMDDVSAPASSVIFIGLNPSTADEKTDDATIRKCIGFARRWNYGGVIMLNLFTLVSTDPRGVERAGNPNHEDANQVIRMYAGEETTIVCAWGRFPFAQKRAREVCALLVEFYLKCLEINADGSPMHPLYVPYKRHLENYQFP